MKPAEILSLAKDISIILASIAGGIWAFYKFRKHRSSESKLEIDLIPEVFLNIKSKVVHVSIKLKNIGNVAIYGKIPKNPDCILEVKVIPDKFRDSAIAWEDHKLSSLMPPIKYLEEYDRYYEWGPYMIEPGSTDDVHVLFSTRHNGVVLLKATFMDKDDFFYVSKRVLDLQAVSLKI